MSTIAILGMGLMGGALGLALKKTKGMDVTVHGYARRAETRELAEKTGACDRIFDDPGLAVLGAEIVVVCTPILDIPNLVADIAENLRAGAVVTDVGSTKAMLMNKLTTVLDKTDACFVGSHPMAGSEKTGIEAASSDLYHDAVVIVTPAGSPEGSVAAERVMKMWASVGARVVEMDAAAHDAIVAGTSHVPHLMAALLVKAAARTTAHPGLFCGPGFRDSTRIAAGSENVWHDIVKSNPDSIRACLHALRADLDDLLADLDRGDFDAVRDLLADARQTRATILSQSVSTIETAVVS